MFRKSFIIVFAFAILIFASFATAYADDSTMYFNHVYGISSEVENVEYQEGGENRKMHKLLGQTRFRMQGAFAEVSSLYSDDFVG